MREHVRVQLVMYWDCPRCNHVNYQHGRALDHEAAAEATEEGENPDEFRMMPDVVFCQKCEADFTPNNEEL